MKTIPEQQVKTCQEFEKVKKIASKFQKIWKYKLNYYCNEHNQKYTLKCKFCKKLICLSCEQQENGKKHIFTNIFCGEQQDQTIKYEKYIELKNLYCKSNVVSYIDQKTKKQMILFCSIYYLNDFDLEQKCIKRQLKMPESFYHIKVIKDTQLLIWRTHTVRMFEIKSMNQKLTGKLDFIIHDIEYFQNRQILVVSSEGGGIYLMNMNLKLVKKIEDTEKLFFFEIDKLSQRHLICSSIQPTIQMIYTHKIDIVTGQKEELFKNKTDHRSSQRLNFLLTMLDCNKNYRKINQKTLEYVNTNYGSSYISKLIENQFVVLINFHKKRLVISDIHSQEIVQIISLPSNSVMYYYVLITDEYIIIPANDFLIYKRKPLQIKNRKFNHFEINNLK